MTEHEALPAIFNLTPIIPLLPLAAWTANLIFGAIGLIFFLSAD